MNAFAINGVLIAVISIPLAIYIAANARKEKDRWLLALFTFAVSIWGIGGFFIAQTQNPELALFYWRLTHVGIIMIPAFFLHFVVVFLGIQKAGKFLFISYALAAFFQIANGTGDLICCVRYVFNEFYYDSPPTALYVLFTAYFVTAIIIAHYWLIRAYRASREPDRTRILYVLLGSGIGFLGGTPSFFPVFQTDLYPILNFSVPFFATFVAIGVLRYQLLQIKVIATELFVAGLWVVIFFQFFTQFIGEESLNAQIIQGIIWIVIIFLSIFLVRSVQREVKQRERLEYVTRELQRANDELRRLDEQKSDFISIASHQLRTPLTVIKGYLSLLFENSFGALPKQFSEPLKKIALSNDRLLRLVEDLLDLSRIERGKMTYVFQKASLTDIVDEVYQEMREAAKQKKLSFALKKPEHPLPRVYADPKKIKEVLVNIIDNAIHYTPSGSVTLAVTHDPKRNVIRVSVADTGIGMTPDDIRHIFVKFSRMENATRVSSEGTGLGLYVAKLIIEDHKGKIWAESAGHGKGSLFAFELPTV